MGPAREGHAGRKDRDLGMRWLDSWVSLRAHSSGRAALTQARQGWG